MKEQEIKKFICEIGKRVWERNMVAANDGNFSVKLENGDILCTPTGVSKGFMTPDMICKINSSGELLESDKIHKPSSEIKMHLRVYKRRSDVKAVVHAHPMYATSHAISGVPLNKQIIPESTILLGEVPLAKYGLPSTNEIPNSIEPFLDDYDAVLLENHGALTWGTSLNDAYFKLEGLEFYAQLNFVSSILGNGEVNELSNYEVNRLMEIRTQMNILGRHPFIKNK
ncbi:class II aldolase/adducin family protein [Miniphocaeibacter halophilus]|uniref:Class II aldolase/adducin family protein n=1 Tax=Miniphocaeibacter halophilus TaxID=2931922 RepID=A0AC61MTR7_9FIRM|nr:class II aldolase/adducin family protein [Miniphocaeibacter halophilus]QQK09012.1 class II aldolase/adducin family protein [Miniphocaeibacter halophilus]